MSFQDQEFLDYLKDVILRNPLIQSGSYDVDPWSRRVDFTWVHEAAEALAALEQCFLIDRVVVVYNATNEDRRPETASVKWCGFCYDCDGRDWYFEATWHLNMDLFSKQHAKHYYELTDLELEPRVDYDRRRLEWGAHQKSHKKEGRLYETSRGEGFIG